MVETLLFGMAAVDSIFAIKSAVNAVALVMYKTVHRVVEARPRLLHTHTQAKHT